MLETWIIDRKRLVCGFGGENRCVKTSIYQSIYQQEETEDGGSTSCVGLGTLEPGSPRGSGCHQLRRGSQDRRFRRRSIILRTQCSF